jgi:hypothetical protein
VGGRSIFRCSWETSLPEAVFPRASTGNNGKRGRREQPPQATGGGKIGNECPISEWSPSDGSTTWRPWRLRANLGTSRARQGQGTCCCSLQLRNTSSATTVRARELPRRVERRGGEK